MAEKGITVSKITNLLLLNFLLITACHAEHSELASEQTLRLANSSISIKTGLYGMSLDSSQSLVKETIGKPNAILRLNKNVVVWGYGRTHWLYFDNGKLVNFSTKPPYLSQESINNIVHSDTFDNLEWQVNQKFKYRDNLEKIKNTLATNYHVKQNKTGKEVIISENQHKLSLVFERY